jgi:hypothetical protein
MHITLKDGFGGIPHQDRVPLVQGCTGAFVLHEQLDESPETGDSARVSEIVPQLGIDAEADAILTSESQAQIHVFTSCVRKPLIEWELLCGVSLHAEIQRRHVPEFLPVGEQPLAGQGAVDLVVPVQQR